MSGDLEHVPLKVVPMYVETEPSELVEDELEVEPEPEEGPERERLPILGAIALLLAVATAVVHGIAVGVASGGDDAAGTVLAYVAIGLSALAALTGIAALIVNLGRRTGAAAIVLAVLANPFVLLVVLRWIGGSAV